MIEKKKDSWKEEKMIIRDEIKDSNEIVKNILNFSLFLGSISFLIAGISSYLNVKILMFINPEGITFFPQGATMCFYGTCGIIFSINQIIITYNKVGEGYNKFDKTTGKINIYRKSMIGSQEDINIIYDISDVESIKIENKKEPFNNKQNLLICLKNKKEIPIYSSDFLNTDELENKASEVAYFLNVPIKTIG